jgi:hypothetical protein
MIVLKSKMESLQEPANFEDWANLHLQKLSYRLQLTRYQDFEWIRTVLEEAMIIDVYKNIFKIKL